MISYNNYNVLNESLINDFNENISNNFSLIGSDYNKKFKYINSNNKFNYSIEIFVEKQDKNRVLNYLQYEFLFIKSDTEIFEVLEIVNNKILKASKSNIKLLNDTNTFIELNNIPNLLIDIDNSNNDFDIFTFETDLPDNILNKKCSQIRLCYLIGDSIRLKMINEYKYFISLEFSSVNDVINEFELLNESSGDGYDLNLDGEYNRLFFGDITTNSTYDTFNDSMMIVGNEFTNYTNESQGFNDKLICFAMPKDNMEGKTGRCLIINLFSIVSREVFDTIIIENIEPTISNTISNNDFNLNMSNQNGNFSINYLHNTNNNNLVTVTNVLISSDGLLLSRTTETISLYGKVDNMSGQVSALSDDTLNLRYKNTNNSFYSNTVSIFGAEPDNDYLIEFLDYDIYNYNIPRILNFNGTNAQFQLLEYWTSSVDNKLKKYDSNGFEDYNLNNILTSNLPNYSINSSLTGNFNKYYDGINKQYIGIAKDNLNGDIRLVSLSNSNFKTSNILYSNITVEIKQMMFISNEYYLFITKNNSSDVTLLKLDANFNVIATRIIDGLNLSEYDASRRFYCSYGTNIYIYTRGTQEPIVHYINIINESTLLNTKCNLITNEKITE